MGILPELFTAGGFDPASGQAWDGQGAAEFEHDPNQPRDDHGRFGKKFGKSKARVQVRDEYAVKKVLGEKYSQDDLSSLVGAPDDAEVSVSSNRDDVLIKVSHPDFEAKRLISRDKDGKIFMVNSEFWVRSDAQGKGLGADVFGRQVENAIDMGVAYIKCHAAKENPEDPNAPHNGYYTWPRLGYDMSLTDFDGIDDLDKDAYARARDEFPRAKTILDIMSTKDGRDWWKANGADILNARFDLTPGSRSMKIFEAYQHERGQKAR